MFDDYPVLSLNGDLQPLSYTPLSLLSWQDAVHMLIAERVQVIEEYDVKIRSPSLVLPLPAVVKLCEHHDQYRRAPYNRLNLFVRDRGACVYCGTRLAMDELTVDHVKPRSRGGKTSFANLVAACAPCNTLKRDRLPEEIGLRPVEPWHPTIAELNARAKRLRLAHLERLAVERPSWAAYIL